MVGRSGQMMTTSHAMPDSTQTETDWALRLRDVLSLRVTTKTTKNFCQQILCFKIQATILLGCNTTEHKKPFNCKAREQQQILLNLFYSKKVMLIMIDNNKTCDGKQEGNS